LLIMSCFGRAIRGGGELYILSVWCLLITIDIKPPVFRGGLKKEVETMDRLRLGLYLALIFILIFTGVTWAEDKEILKEFNTLVERAKNTDDNLDFQALRMLYTKTPYYSPYGNRFKSRELFDLLRRNEFAQVVEKTTPLLTVEFVNIDLHYLRMVAFDGLGDREMKAWHEYMTYGLLYSILDGGDGRTPQTAFQVISIGEEYMVLNYLGCQLLRQSLEHIGGHSYDVMEIQSEAGDTVKLYFNVDKPLAWLSSQFMEE